MVLKSDADLKGDLKLGNAPFGDLATGFNHFKPVDAACGSRNLEDAIADGIVHTVR